MKENKKQSNFNRTRDNRNADISIIARLFFSIFSFRITDLFETSKAFSEKLLIRFANIRV
jgi:hypothetical protein